jgi:hypothetical protein
MEERGERVQADEEVAERRQRLVNFLVRSPKPAIVTIGGQPKRPCGLVVSQTPFGLSRKCVLT